MTIPIGSGLPLPAELATLAREMPGRNVSPQSPELVPQIGSGGVSGTAPAGTDFGDRVSEFLGDVTRMDANATRMADGYARGEHDDVHGTLIAMQEADVALRFTASVRNRVIEAYREVMRMGG